MAYLAAMIIGCVQARISIPHAQSLKDKRMVVKSLKDRMRNRLNVSVAEVGDQDLWQSCVLAVVTVAAHRDVVDKRVSDVSDALHSDPRFVLVDYHVEML
jgi:uncharacterized protein YlxP (DUF503 family)